MATPKIYALNAVASGFDTLNILTDKIKLTGIIGLDTDNTSTIANYSSTDIWAKEHNIPYYSVSNYSFKNDEDIATIQALEIDILIVTGWQRLVPQWLIEQCKIGIIGSHGSPWGITEGRGRSPQNWAIIMGEETFSLSAFLIQPGADDGNVLATQQYQLGTSDDIVSSYVKVNWLYAQMLIKVIPKLINGWRGVPQFGKPKYLPQRTFEDGRIDWKWNSMDIDKQIRALTKPYPGAWTIVNEKVVYIWKGQPIEDLLGFDAEPGTIIAMYLQIPAFLVKTGDGALLIREWEIIGNGLGINQNSFNELKVGQRIDENFNGYKQLRNIFQLHMQKYPDKKIAEPLVRWSEKYANEK